MWPFKKSAEKTLREAGNLVEKGWSPDQPVQLDSTGNITHRCAATAVASVPRANPRSWGFLQNVMGGIAAPIINKEPGMTREKMVSFFRKAEADARVARA